MQILSFFILVLIVGLAWVGGNSIRFGCFSKTIVSPLKFYSALLAFFALDFFYLNESLTTNIFEFPIKFSASEVAEALAIFTVNAVMFSCGMLFGILRAPYSYKEPSEYFKIKNRHVKSLPILIFLLIVVAAFALMGLLANIKSIIDAEFSRQVFFRDNKVIYLAYSIVCPVMAVMFAIKSRFDKLSISIFLLSVIFLFLSGSRGVVILAILIFACAACVNGARIKSYWLLISFPFIVLFLLYSRYFFREQWRYSSFESFLNSQGGIGPAFFNTSEISMAEVIVMVIDKVGEINFHPFESFLGFLMYPLPREIFLFKPESASAVFTASVSPERWNLTKSEIVVTGFGDLIMQFGFVWSLPILFVLGMVWGYMVCWCIKQSAFYAKVGVPFLMWWLYVFMRADIFNMGSTFWSLAFSMCLFWCISRVIVIKNKIKF